MTTVGQIEKKTRQRIVKLLCEQLDSWIRYLPLWRKYQEQLNRAPLEHGSWEYQA